MKMGSELHIVTNCFSLKRRAQIYIAMIFVVLAFDKPEIPMFKAKINRAAYADNTYDCSEYALDKINSSMQTAFLMTFSSSSGWPIRGLKIDSDFNIQDWTYRTHRYVQYEAQAVDERGNIYILSHSGSRWQLACYDKYGATRWIREPSADFSDAGNIYNSGPWQDPLYKMVVGSKYLFVVLRSSVQSTTDWLDPRFYLIKYDFDGLPLNGERIVRKGRSLDDVKIYGSSDGGIFAVYYQLTNESGKSGTTIEKIDENGDAIWDLNIGEQPDISHLSVNEIYSDENGGAFIVIGNESQSFCEQYIMHLTKTGTYSISKNYGQYVCFNWRALTCDGEGNIYFKVGRGEIKKISVAGDLVWKFNYGDSGENSHFGDVELGQAGDIYILYGVLERQSGSEIIFVTKIGASGNLLWQKGMGEISGNNYVKYVNNFGLTVVGSKTAKEFQSNMIVRVLREESGEELFEYTRSVAETCEMEKKDERDDESCGCGY